MAGAFLPRKGNRDVSGAGSAKWSRVVRNGFPDAANAPNL